MTRFLLVCLGGALGSGARYLVVLATPAAGTLIVNLAGSFLLALIMEMIPPSDLRVMLTVGVMGGFTTYSTFNYETTSYFRQGAWTLGAVNVAATVLGCLIGGLAGLAVARALAGR
jgi:CrcB protein